MNMHSEQSILRERDITLSSNEFSWMKKLPDLLRILGTGALLIAMYSFLIKGWGEGNDVFRYLLMLGHTGVLAAIGLASGHWLKESKGARLLLTLALVSVPANFAILGAFIFSQSKLVNISQYPNYVAWSVDSMQTALMTSGGALLILLPVTLLGFTVLARSLSKRLTILFLISSAALLLPIRDPMMVGLVVLALMVMTIIFTRKSAQQNIAAKTQEGIIALSLQALPLAILMGRTLWLYSADMFLLTVMTTTIYLMLRQSALFYESDSRLKNRLNRLSLIPAIATAPLLVFTLIDINWAINALVLPIATTVSAIMIYDIAQRNENNAATYRWMAALMIVVGMTINMGSNAGLLAAISCITAGVILLILGYKNKQRGFFINGFILMLIGLVQQFYELVHHFNLGSWASMAVMGILTIVIASVIEAKGNVLHQHFSTWKTNFKQWEG